MRPAGLHRFSTSGSRWGFNGQEKDNEVSGEGNSYTAEFWEYDSRLGRRWNRDPEPNETEGTYTCFNDNPIRNSDIKGNFPSPGLGPIMWSWSNFKQNVKGAFNQAVYTGFTMNAYCTHVMTSASECLVSNTTSFVENIHEKVGLKWELTTNRGEYTEDYLNEGENPDNIYLEYKAKEMVVDKKIFDNYFDYLSLGMSAVPSQAINKVIQLGKGVLGKVVRNISLGVKWNPLTKTNQLDEFAKVVGSPHSSDWLKQGLYNDKIAAGGFASVFKYVTDKVIETGGRIKFNLNNFDIGGALKARNLSLYDKANTYTNWEFNQIINNKALLKNTDFYYNGKIVDVSAYMPK